MYLDIGNTLTMVESYIYALYIDISFTCIEVASGQVVREQVTCLKQIFIKRQNIYMYILYTTLLSFVFIYIYI